MLLYIKRALLLLVLLSGAAVASATCDYDLEVRLKDFDVNNARIVTPFYESATGYSNCDVAFAAVVARITYIRANGYWANLTYYPPSALVTVRPTFSIPQ